MAEQIGHRIPTPAPRYSRLDSRSTENSCSWGGRVPSERARPCDSAPSPELEMFIRGGGYGSVGRRAGR